MTQQEQPSVEGPSPPPAEEAAPLVEKGAQGSAPLVEEGAPRSAPLVEEGAQRPSRNHPGSFGDAAGEMGEDTEVEFTGAEFTDDLARAHVDLAKAEADVGALTGDLQRLQAEFLNYKRRVDRDRELIRQNAAYSALTPIVEVLDTIDRAREHGPLDGGLKAVAEQLERVVTAQGLVRFGEPGDAFDPTLHEALSHIGEDPEVTVTTCKVVAKAGYRMGDRVVRAAQVLVVDPVSQPAGEEPVDPAG